MTIRPVLFVLIITIQCISFNVSAEEIDLKAWLESHQKHFYPQDLLQILQMVSC